MPNLIIRFGTCKVRRLNWALSVLFSFQGVLLLILLVLTFYITCNFFRDVRVADLEKKAVLITGCDSGFGYELAKKLDALGLRVFAACLTSDGEAKLTKECSRELRTFKFDVTKEGDVQNALEVVKSGLPSQGTVTHSIFFFLRILFFPAEAEYSYFSVDFRLKIFL